jgi:hypothetical protein
MDIYSCLVIKCPEYKCQHTISKSQIEAILDKEYIDKYNKHIVQNYIINNKKNIKYCPQLNCNVISMGDCCTNTVYCLCTYEYCFQCHKDAHLPCSCIDLNKWENNVDEFNDNNVWLIANTKKCPKCFTNIEKNEGCNHMTCKNCKYEFCWLCSIKWGGHSPDSKECKEYKIKMKESNILYDDKDIENAKIEVDKLNHYTKLIQETNKIISMVKELEKQNDDIHFVKYYKNVIKFNTFLKYCYIFIIYNKDNNKEIFIMNFNIFNENIKICNNLIKDIAPNTIQLNNVCAINNKIIDNIIDMLE